VGGTKIVEDADKLLRAGKRKRLEENAVDDAKGGDVGANAQGQGQNGYDGEGAAVE
jgi:hypothetical protein